MTVITLTHWLAAALTAHPPGSTQLLPALMDVAAAARPDGAIRIPSGDTDALRALAEVRRAGWASEPELTGEGARARLEVPPCG